MSGKPCPAATGGTPKGGLKEQGRWEKAFEELHGGEDGYRDLMVSTFSELHIWAHGPAHMRKSMGTVEQLI